MGKQYRIWLLVALVALPSVLAQSPEKQYGFAEELRGDGDEILALLEYRRFAYLYPKHEKAAEALLQAAMIRLRHTREVSKAERTLGRIAEGYPDSKVAERAAELKKFAAVNSDYQGEPLALYLQALQETGRGNHARALELFGSIVEKWKDAQLADDAMLEAAKVHLQQTNEPKKAREKLDALLETYPKRSTVPEATYRRAEAVLKIQGAGTEAMNAFRSVTEKFPKSAYAQEARKRIDELEKQRSFVKRTYDKSLVRDYEVVSSGYEDGTEYVEEIELPSTSSLEQVRATMEDALIKAVGKRRDQKHSVKIEAYYNYPVTEAGEVTWSPGKDPAYEVEERETEDRLKDTLFDIFRGR